MNCLVAYGGSDSENDISDSDEEQNTNTAANNAGNSEGNKSTQLFEALPLPKVKSKGQSVFEEEDDEFLHKKETPIEVPCKPPPITRIPGKKTQIFLPSLSSFNDDNDADSQTTLKFKPSSKGTGLLNMLPQPKSSQVPEQIMKKIATSLIPDSVKNKPVVKNTGASAASKISIASNPVKPETKKSGLALIKYDSSDESDTETDKADFFSLNKGPELFSSEDSHMENSAISTQSNFNNVQQQIQVEENITEKHYVEEHQTLTNVESKPLSNDYSDIDNEALQKLAGSHAKRRGESIQFININQNEILPDPREWLVKAISEDTTKRMSSSKRRGDEPTTQQRKKHQITYLAHQAKANEQELQNQWANNRLSKKQTQSKYGF